MKKKKKRVATTLRAIEQLKAWLYGLEITEHEFLEIVAILVTRTRL